MKKQKKTCLDDRHSEVLADYLGGMRVVDMARKYAVNVCTVYRWKVAHDIPKRPNFNRRLKFEARDKAIVADRRARFDLQEIAAKYGLTSSHISRICVAAGVKINDSGVKSYSDLHWANIEWDYRHYVPNEEILEKYGISMSTLYRSLREHGVSTLERRKLREKQILYERTHGMTTKECAEKHRVSVNLVYRVLRANGIKPKELSKQPVCKIKGKSWREQNDEFWRKKKGA